MNSLGALYLVQGRYREAELLCRGALAIQVNGLGPEDPDVALALDNLAPLYSRRRQFETSLDLLQRAY